MNTDGPVDPHPTPGRRPADPAGPHRPHGARPARPHRGTALPLHPAIDAALPAGGLPLGALHEAAGAGPDTEHGAAAALFVAGILARQPGPVLWVVEHADLFAPGLAAVGLHPDRVIYAEAGKPDAVLQAMEEGLRQPGLAGVVGEIGGRLTLTASRRLQLAAEASGTSPSRCAAAASTTTRRWRSRPPPSQAGGSPPCRRRRRLPHAPDTPGLGRQRWRLELVRCRGGRTINPGSWRHAMRRVVSVWLPTLATDRLRRHGAAPPAGAANGSSASGG